MEKLMETLSQQLAEQDLGSLALDWGGKLLGAIVLLIIGRWVARRIVNWQGRLCAKAEVDDTLAAFLGSLTYAILMVIIILTALGVLGVPTTNFLAIVGAAGLAIGLALKDSLSNFAAGVMLVFFRPFTKGDYVEAAGTGGKVVSVRIFNTVLTTPDNRVITIPNSLIYADTITNFSAQENRRIDLVIGIGYEDDIAKAFEIIQNILSREDRVLDDPEATIMLLELGASSVDLAVRPWVQKDDYWGVRSDLLIAIKTSLEEAGLSIPYPQQDVHLIGQVAQS